MTPETAAALIPLVQPIFNNLYKSSSGKAKSIFQNWQSRKIIEGAVYRVNNLENLRILFSQERVKLYDFYYKTKIYVDKKRKEIEVNTRSEINKDRNILIIGTVGQGKSCFLRHLYSNEIRSSNKIPLFVELRNIDETKNLFDLISDQIKYIGFDEIEPETLQHFLQSGFFTLFLDGLDEIRKTYILRTKDELRKIEGIYKNTKTVITSRPGSILNIISSNADYDEAVIAKLKTSDYIPFLEKLNHNNKDGIEKLASSLINSKIKAQGIITTPLMLTLVSHAFGTSVNIPETLDYFYKSLFSILVSRHDHQKDQFIRERATNLNDLELEEVFQAFSFSVKINDFSHVLKEDEFIKCAKDASESTDKEFHPSGLKTDLTEFVCLMQPDGLNTSYIHKSIQEFYTAAFISNLKDSEQINAIYEHLQSNEGVTWPEEIKFLEKIDNINYKKFIYKKGLEQLSEIFTKKPSKKEFDNFLKENFIGIMPVNEKNYWLIDYNSKFCNPGFFTVSKKPFVFFPKEVISSSFLINSNIKSISQIIKGDKLERDDFYDMLKAAYLSKDIEIRKIDAKIEEKKSLFLKKFIKQKK